MTLLTIIVPTKNRQETALCTVRSLMRWKDDEFEVLVQDCSATPSLGSEIERTIPDRRIEYRHEGGSPSMTDNWNRAVAGARGRYVLIIGDDDTAVPDIIARARWADRLNLDAVAFRHSMYWWPNYPAAGRAGRLAVPRCTGRVRILDSVTTSEEMLQNRAQRVQGLPEIYHGLVSRRRLEQLKERTGEYFRTNIPDCYAAWALSFLGMKYAIVDYPLTIAGFSNPSNSGRGKRGAMTEHYQEYGDVELSGLLPRSEREPSLTMYLADAIITAMETADNPRSLGSASLAGVYASFLLDNPPQARTVWLQYREALQAAGADLKALDALRELAGAAGTELKARAFTRIVENVPAGALKARHYYVCPAIDIDDAASRQIEHMSLSPDCVDVTVP